MAINTVTIQMRMGLEADFDPSKMLPGEWAVSTDTRYVRMCFSPGIVLRMATYESFEADMAQIQAILAECKDIKSAIQRIQSEVNAKASLTIEYANAAEKSAKNAKQSEEKAKMYAENASAVSGIEIATKGRAGVMKGGDNSVAEDGALELTRTTTSRTLTDSYAGGLKINEIVGASEQSENQTPEDPQPIESVGDSGSLEITITGEGKNLFNPKSQDYVTNLSMDKNDMKFTQTSVSGTRNYYLPCKPGTKYSYSKSIGATVRLFSCPEIPAVDGSVTVVGETSDVNYVSITTGPNDNYIGVYPLWSTELGTISWEDVLNSIQIEEGEPTVFEPYWSNTVIIPLSEPLRGIEDDTDKVTCMQGLYGEERDIYAFTLDGTETWSKSSAAENLFYTTKVRNIARASNEPMICEIYPSTLLSYLNMPDKSIKHAVTTAGQQNLYVKDSSFASAAEIKAWFAANPTRCLVKRAIPVFEPFDTDVQIKLNSLMAYKGTNHIYVSGEIQPIVEVEHGTSAVGAYTLESFNISKRNELHISKLNELTNSIATAMVEREE